MGQKNRQQVSNSGPKSEPSAMIVRVIGKNVKLEREKRINFDHLERGAGIGR